MLQITKIPYIQVTELLLVCNFILTIFCRIFLFIIIFILIFAERICNSSIYCIIAPNILFSLLL